MRFTFNDIRWPLVGILIIIIIQFVPPVKGVIIMSLAPLIRVTRLGGEGLIGQIKIIANIPKLAKENGQLRGRINDLSALEIKNKEYLHENELLRRELSILKPETAGGLIAAQVISRSSSVSQQSIQVNKGAEEGFVQNMAVIAQGYYVGRVDEVLPHTSRIILLTSTESLVPVVLQDSRSVGLLRGGVEGLLIDEIPRDVTINQNEAVVTSNIGDVIASGIPVGSIGAILSGKSDVFQSARVNSPIDLSRLEIVFGVKP